MIIIHQAIYGEVPGKTSGHDLLAASDEKSELFKRISGYTDLADRPDGGILSEPIVRGLYAEDHFLLIKTFPDKSPGLRSGRVFSHALIVSKVDLNRVGNLNALFQYHLSSIQKEAKMYPLTHQSENFISKEEAVDAREAAATNALLESEHFVWLGKKGYWEWVFRIWPQLSLAIKQKLKIGAAFGPSNYKSEYLNLLYIPESAKTLWNKHQFQTIDVENKEDLKSAAAHWIVGNTQKAVSFQTLLDDFDPNLESIETLKRLQDYGKIYNIKDKEPGLNHLLVLANFVSQISPNARVGVKGKNNLLTSIIQAIPKASVAKFTALSYQSWKGFPNALTTISVSIRDWLQEHLLQGKEAKKNGSVLVKALNDQAKGWWATIILEFINERLEKRVSGDADILWQWMKREPTLISQHSSWLPDDAENELIQKIPKLEKTTAKAALQMAEQKGWLVFHAKLAAQCYTAEKAIDSQLLIDTNEKHMLGLQALSEAIKDSSLVRVAVERNDTRLHQLAGKLIYKNSKLLKHINIAKEGWQRCWESAIEQGAQVWGGIPNPQKILFEIMDHLFSGNAFSDNILIAMSVTKHSSLKSYPERESIWAHLPEKARNGFITGTLTDLIEELASNKLNFSELEIELKTGLQSQKLHLQIINDKTIPLASKLQLFNVIPNIGENQAKQLIITHHFLPEDAEEFGRIVSNNKWKTIVDVLYNNRFKRKDLNPALLRCSHLLNLFQRFGLSISGLKQDAITQDEWWNLFLNNAVKLYPTGPNQNGLWLSAGGKLEELNRQGISGKESWSFAIESIRKGGLPSAKKLLLEMQKEYPGDNILIQLIQSL